MITLYDFIKFIETIGSDASVALNTNILGGVPGMPLTHQIGFGHNWRKRGKCPTEVDMDELNFETHLKMVAITGAGSLGLNVIDNKSSHWIEQILGGVVLSYSLKEANELFLDWKAGEEAAHYLDDEYFISRSVERPQRKSDVEQIIDSIQMDHRKQQFNFIGNHPPMRKIKQKRLRRKGYMGNQSVY